MKRYAALLLAALLAVLLTVPALAAREGDLPEQAELPQAEAEALPEAEAGPAAPLDGAAATEEEVIYSGKAINAFDGSLVTNADDGESDARIMISAGVWYDPQARNFILDTGDGEITANIVPEMVTTGTVSISLGEDAGMVSLYRNGVMMEEARLSSLDAPGKYVLKLGRADDPQAYSMTFTIVNSVSGALYRFDAPSGFSIVNVDRDGELFPWSPTSVDLSQEGAYEIGCRCLATNEKYDLSFTVDHTPPVLALEAVVDGRASGPVDVSDLEEGASISATLNGSPIGVGKELSRSGSYVLTVTDAAGNTSTYQFQILIYFNNNSLVFFAVVLALLAALGIYLLLNRRRLRIS